MPVSKTVRFIKLVSAFAGMGYVTFTLTGCAWIMEGNQQTVHVHCIPSDGIEALLNGREVAHLQGEFHLSKKRDTHYLTLSRERYHSSTVAFNREINPFWPVANLVWGPFFPVGWLVDWMTGSVYQLEPRDLHVVLKPHDE